jgi:hypothetical protein
MQPYISDLSPKGISETSHTFDGGWWPAVFGYESIDQETEAGKFCIHLSVQIPSLNPFLATTSQYPARLIGWL